MHHLMRKRILEMLSVLDVVGTYEDAMIGAETTRLPVDRAISPQRGGTATAVNIGRVYSSIESLNLVGHEANDGRIGKEPVAVSLTSFAVFFFLDFGCVLSEEEFALGCHLAREHFEVVHPP